MYNKNTVLEKVLLAALGFSLAFFMVSIASAENLTVTLRAGEYRIVNVDRGQRIEMDGFGYLMEPGKPMLPAKSSLIALPPGARAQSVEVKGIGATQLPRTYQIVPCPPIMPSLQASDLIQKLQKEWERNNQAVYSSDQAYPEERGKLTGSGGLRKYAYASVSFSPFDYHPQSGRLIYYDGAQVSIEYSLPLPGSAEAKRVERLKWDTIADERASRLFVNFQEAKEWYQPRGVRPKGQSYDYVIITTTGLQSGITSSNFISWKQDSLGYKVKTVLTTDTLITNRPGSDPAAKIRNFLRTYYPIWGIKYVLLVGDYTAVPMRYCYPDPSNHSFFPAYPESLMGEVPTDYYYADLSSPDNSSWDKDGDGYYGEYGYWEDWPDFAAEVYVGRIPTSSTTQITTTLNKLVTFERNTGTWKDQALHAGAILWYANEDYSGAGVTDGAYCMDLIESNFMSGWTISHYSEQAGLAPSSYAWGALSEAAFTSDWRNGQYGVVNWVGHGWSNSVARKVWSWDDGDNVPETQSPDEMSWFDFISTSSNLDEDHPSIVFAMSCLVGYPEPNAWGRLGVDLLTISPFGSSAGIVSASRISWGTPGWTLPWGGGESMCYEFNHYVINGPNGSEKVGDALYDSKLFCNQNYGWTSYHEYWNMYDFNLYGDPSLTREGTVKPPKVVSTLPAINALNVAKGTNITATFDEGMDASSFNNSTVVVYGSDSGPHSGTISYNSGTKAVTFDPTSDFYDGEMVTVVLSTGIKSSRQASLGGYVWSFTVVVTTPTAGSFSSPSTYTTGANTNPYCITDGDLDKDGDVDLATANYIGQNVSVLSNNGDGTFPSPTKYNAGDMLHSICNGDFNGDGFGDLAVTNNALDSVAVMLNDGTGGFLSPTRYAVGDGPWAVSCGDVDGDGNIDLVSANLNSSNVSVLLGNGDGTFVSPTNYNASGFPYGVCPIDMNNDGAIDLAIPLGYGYNYVSVLLNTGSGQFGSPTLYPAGAWPFAICGADFNGDGYSDIAIGNYSSDSVSVLLNDGSGALLAQTNYYVGTGPYSVCSGDLDGDGDVDLAAGLYGLSKAAVLLNNGDGTFASVTTYSVAGGPYSIQTAELNGDGAMDLSLANYGQSNVAILLNVVADVTPPAAITDLTATDSSSSSITLKWTAPGDDGNTGTAAHYDIRYSTSPVGTDTASWWAAADTVSNEPSPSSAGSQDSCTAIDLSSNTTYYFVMKTADEVPNWSGFSNVAIASTPVGIDEITDRLGIPKTFALSQNYPNPFNPVTQIRYALPKDCQVRLNIYNVVGQRVAALVDGEQRAGYKTVIWDAYNLSSGIYFYRIQASNFTDTKKMILLR